MQSRVQWLWDIESDSLTAFMYPGGGGSETRVPIPGEGQFIEYESDDQLAPLARKLADAAADRVRYFRDVFPSVDAAAKVLAKCEGVDWDIEAGVAFGLTGDYKSARQRFDHYLEWDESDDGQAWRGEWMDARADRVRALSACVDDTAHFKAKIAEDSRARRSSRSRCQDGQPPGFSASSVWGISARFRLQIEMIRAMNRVLAPHRLSLRYAKIRRARQ